MTRILIKECKKEQPFNTLPETAGEEYDALPLQEAIRRAKETGRRIPNDKK